jgi:hypothetical protein
LCKVRDLEAWIFKVLNVSPEVVTKIQTDEATLGMIEAFTSFIRDGRILCQLVNKIKPGLVQNINNVELHQVIKGFTIPNF